MLLLTSLTRRASGTAASIASVLLGWAGGCNEVPANADAGGSGDTGGGSSCASVTWADADEALVLELDFTTAIPADAQERTLCSGDTHYYLLDPPCEGWVQVYLRGATGSAFDNDDHDMDLLLTEDYAGMSFGTVHESKGHGADVTQFEAIHAKVEAGDPAHRIEVSHEAGDDIDYVLETRFFPRGTCAPAGFLCEATNRIEAEETSCLVEPTPSCSSTSTNDVTLPRVDDGTGLVDGWIVYVAPDEVTNVHNPRSSELAFIESRCEDACADEWATNDDVTANCTVTNGFEDPRVVDTDSHPAENLIAQGDEDGSGIFMGQSLSCNLATTCCEDFDEDICPASLERDTTATLQLGRGEEYRLAIAGASEVEINTNAGTWTSGLAGEVGFSLCPDGNQQAPCPFYLGSAEVEATATPTITLDCPDGSQRSEQMTDLEISLLQPAFGIDGQNNNTKGFPAGGLVLEASATVGGKTYRERGATNLVALLTASPTSFSVSGAPVSFMVDCGAHTERVDLTFDLEEASSGAVLEEPPTLTITTPSQVTCGQTTNLTANASDPDGDLDTVRWYVDDVLLAPTVSSLVFTEAHTLRAVARDDRGATTTDEIQISCL